MVVRVSNTKAAKDTLVDNGVEDLFRMVVNKCERSVVFPEPDSPLDQNMVSSWDS